MKIGAFIDRHDSKRLTAALWVPLALVAIYFIFFEQPFLSYRNLPFPVITKAVKPGEAVQMVVSRCNSESITRISRVASVLVGPDAEVILPVTDAPILPGCSSSVSAVNVIPPGTPPGRYMLRGYGEVIGTFRTHMVEWESQFFDVIEGSQKL